MKNIFLLFLFVVATAFSAETPANVQKIPSTGQLTGSFVVGPGKSLTTSGNGTITATNLAGNVSFAGNGTLTLNGNTTFSNQLTFAGTNGSTLNIGTGGTLGASALLGVEPTPVNYTTLGLWGDSITANPSYWQKLTAAMGYQIYNGGVSGESSASILARLQAAPSTWSYPTIIWAGRNDGPTWSTTVANIASMVSTIGHNRYLVLSIVNSSSEPSGSAAYVAIAGVNATLASTYGTRFVDARAIGVNNYNPYLPTDVANFAQDIPANSLRVDALHPNTDWYALLTPAIQAKVAILQGTTTTLTDPHTLPSTVANDPRFVYSVSTGDSAITRTQTEYLASATWTSTGWTGTWNPGYTHTTGNTTALTGTIPGFLTNTLYLLTATISGRTAGSISVTMGGAAYAAGATASFAAGLRSANATSPQITVTPTTDFDGTVLLSVKAIGTAPANRSFYDTAGTVAGELRFGAGGGFNTGVGINALSSISGTNANTAVGAYAGRYITTGQFNTVLGANAATSMTAGANNVILGFNAATNSTLSVQNVVIGSGAAQNLTTGASNVIAGFLSGFSLTTGVTNVFLGFTSGYTTTTGSNNVFLGEQTGGLNQTGSGNVYIGNNAGYFQLGSDTLIIDNRLRANAAAQLTDGLITGSFNATPAAQSLRFNAVINLLGTTMSDTSGKILSAALNTVGVAQGGTGQTTYTNGQLLIGNTTGNTLTKATLTAGAGIGVANSTGSITLTQTGMSTLRTGTATLVGGTVTVSDAATGATTRIRLSYLTPGGTPGAAYVSAKVNATSFTITSTSASDTSAIYYEAFEP